MDSRVTRSKQRVLDAFRALERQNRCPPTMREVADVLGVGVSTVHYHVRGLVAAGRMEASRRARSARLKRAAPKRAKMTLTASTDPVASKRDADPSR